MKDAVNVGRVLRLRRNTHWHNHFNFDSLLSRVGLGILGKGGLFVALEEWLTAELTIVHF